MPFEVFVQPRVLLLQTEELRPRPAVPNHQLTVGIQRRHVAELGGEGNLLDVVLVERGAEELDVEPLAGLYGFARRLGNALEDENLSNVGAAHQEVVVERVAQGGDVVVRRRSHLLRVELLAVK